MILTGTLIDTSYTPNVALVTLDEAKTHLKVSGSTEDTLINGLISSAISYCEMYLQRALVSRTMIQYYNYASTADEYIYLQLSSTVDASTTVTVKAYIDTGPSTITNIKLPLDKVRITTADIPDECIYLTAEYSPSVYVRASDIKPAILMKVGEMYIGRSDAEMPKVSAIHSILNMHRLKRHA